AAPPSTFRFRPNDRRRVRFRAMFALLVGFVRCLRSDAHVSQLRRIHERAVVRAFLSSTIPVKQKTPCLSSKGPLALSGMPLGFGRRGGTGGLRWSPPL